MATKTKQTSLERVTQALEEADWEFTVVEGTVRVPTNQYYADNRRAYTDAEGIVVSASPRYARLTWHDIERHLDDEGNLTIEPTQIRSSWGHEHFSGRKMLSFTKDGAYLPARGNQHETYHRRSVTAVLEVIEERSKQRFEKALAEAREEQAKSQAKAAEAEAKRLAELEDEREHERLFHKTLHDMIDSIESAETRGDERPYTAEQIIEVSGQILGTRSRIARLERA